MDSNQYANALDFPEQAAKRGRPLGSKDGPRPDNAPVRGRPRNIDSDDHLADEFAFEELTLEEQEQLRHMDPPPPAPPRPPTPPPPVRVVPRRVQIPPTQKEIELAALRSTARKESCRPFFTHHVVDLSDSDSSDEGSEAEEEVEEDSGNEASEEEVSSRARKVKQVSKSKGKGKAGSTKIGGKEKQTLWFPKPKSMATWCYDYLITVIHPLVTKRVGTTRAFKCPDQLLRSPKNGPPSFWVSPPDPTFALLKIKSDFAPTTLWQPRVYLWLPHFLVDCLACPRCGNALDKNGLLPPRRITDVNDHFYIVSWQYYCRRVGCKRTYRGWSPELLSSLPGHIRLAFPAVISRKRGLSLPLMTLLRVGNQHKMGPAGVRSLLVENHTLKFNQLQLQYLEAILEAVETAAQREGDEKSRQTSVPDYFRITYKPFGSFSDREGYNGEVPSDRYLTEMLERQIEAEEADADQHTSLLPMDQGSLDDSHKLPAHIMAHNGIRTYAAMLSVTAQFKLRQQLLALTMGHEERTVMLAGIANSLRKYGHSPPQIFFSDNPAKDKSLILSAFPSLGVGLAPIALARGLKPLLLPASTSVHFLSSATTIETLIGSILAPLLDSNDPGAHIIVSLDAEWNLNRLVGCSLLQLAPHHMPDQIFLIPLHKLKQLPPSLLRLLVSERVFKVGSKVKGDLTRISKQFLELSNQSFTTIDLKDFALERGLLDRGEKGTLDAMMEKLLGLYMEKDDDVRKSNEWERMPLSAAHLKYATLDVFGSRLLYEKMALSQRLDLVSQATPAGTSVAILTHEGGEIAAYGTIAFAQPTSFAKVRVKTACNNRLVVDVTSVLRPGAAALLHQSMSKRQAKLSKTKCGAFTFEQLRSRELNKSLAPAGFSIVSQVMLLSHDQRITSQTSRSTSPPIPVIPPGVKKVASFLKTQERLARSSSLEPVFGNAVASSDGSTNAYASCSHSQTRSGISSLEHNPLHSQDPSTPAISSAPPPNYPSLDTEEPAAHNSPRGGSVTIEDGWVESDDDDESGDEWDSGAGQQGENPFEYGGEGDDEDAEDAMMDLMENLGLGPHIRKRGPTSDDPDECDDQESDTLRPNFPTPAPPSSPDTEALIAALKILVDERDPEAPTLEYTRIKKDLFHAFQMITMSTTHGMRPTFLRMLRDHILIWDPVIRAKVDKVCRKKFNLSFDQMLLKKPKWVARRCPRYVPLPDILVPAIQLVYDRCGNAKDAKTKLPLFNKKGWEKANAVLELAREGFLSDIVGIVLYEEAGKGSDGLMRYWCCRGTGVLEGGPHGDVYRHFGALNDHRTWYNLQSFAKHSFGVSWDYHHNLGLINRTSFLLNYLADNISGADAYKYWTNGDLYERTTETFGICKLPELLLNRLGMTSYDNMGATRVKMNSSNEWLRRRQGVALPVMPPSSLAARKFYFAELPKYLTGKSSTGKSTFKLEEFARNWNSSAEGIQRVYITPELLSSYGKIWDRVNNRKATEELVKDGIEELNASSAIIQAPNKPFPAFIVGARTITLDPTAAVLPHLDSPIPLSLSNTLSVSSSRPLGAPPAIRAPRIQVNPDLSAALEVDSSSSGSGPQDNSRAFRSEALRSSAVNTPNPFV
ncbi:hypothetical protein P7C70_g6585, partial [Phenoliferia sp. Uapishka_3]